jgi:hypothetical protein
MSTASIARFRCARRSAPAETPRRSLPCSADSPLPTHTPRRLATFTRRMPAARSGLRRPQSAASYANRRTAASLRLTSRLVLICRLLFTNAPSMSDLAIRRNRPVVRISVVANLHQSCLNAASRDLLNPLAAPGRRLEGICEILCLVHDLTVTKLHNANCMLVAPGR